MNQLAHTDGQLRPAANAEIAGVLQGLWEVLPLQAGGDPERRLEGYITALQGKPLWSIESAVRRFIRGEVKGASKKFCPRPPELAEVAGEEVDSYRAETMRIEAEIRANERQRDLPDAPQISDGERARMTFKLSVLSMGLSRAESWRVEEANKDGLEALAALAQKWGVPVPETIWNQLERSRA